MIPRKPSLKDKIYGSSLQPVVKVAKKKRMVRQIISKAAKAVKRTK